MVAVALATAAAVAVAVPLPRYHVTEYREAVLPDRALPNFISHLEEKISLSLSLGLWVCSSHCWNGLLPHSFLSQIPSFLGAWAEVNFWIYLIQLKLYNSFL